MFRASRVSRAVKADDCDGGGSALAGVPGFRHHHHRHFGDGLGVRSPSRGSDPGGQYMANPILTAFRPSVTVTQAEAQAGLLLDNDVTFSDADDDFTAAKLIVTG